MDGKLVYRTLRKISDWTINGFYSELYVSGQENIPTDGPVIITPCHHNEILDIASLSITMPHGRPVCFWAKSTMFRNPVAKAILTSSGSIPVRRNPNNATNMHSNAENGGESTDTRFALFRETFHALDADEIIGVFPEGTSYTEPQIAQIKDGAAWAALEYARWQLQNTGEDSRLNPKKLVVIPVGIVYSNKSEFQSRVFVHFGEAIDIEPYARRHLASADPRAEIKALSAEIESRMFKLTINAKDWDHWFAAEVAKEIYYGDVENIPPQEFVEVSQTFANRLTEESIAETIDPLVKYSALLQHAGIPHGALAAIYPKCTEPTRTRSLAVFSRQLLTTLLHPRSLLFLPIGLLSAPAYAAGALAGRFIANPREPETVAEHKAVCGGLVFGIVSSVVGKLAADGLYKLIFSLANRGAAGRIPEWAMKVAKWLVSGRSSTTIALWRVLGTATVMYLTTWMLFRWHSSLVHWNYKQFLRTVASWKILVATWFPSSTTLTAAELQSVSRPALPTPNPYIKRRTAPAPDAASADNDGSAHQPRARVSMRALAGHLFAARADAEAVVQRVFGARGAGSP